VTHLVEVLITSRKFAGSIPFWVTEVFHYLEILEPQPPGISCAFNRPVKGLLYLYLLDEFLFLKFSEPTDTNVTKSINITTCKLL
jgi:hypothetical protein